MPSRSSVRSSSRDPAPSRSPARTTRREDNRSPPRRSPPRQSTRSPARHQSRSPMRRVSPPPSSELPDFFPSTSQPVKTTKLPFFDDDDDDDDNKQKSKKRAPLPPSSRQDAPAANERDLPLAGSDRKRQYSGEPGRDGQFSGEMGRILRLLGDQGRIPQHLPGDQKGDNLFLDVFDNPPARGSRHASQEPRDQRHLQRDDRGFAPAGPREMDSFDQRRPSSMNTRGMSGERGVGPVAPTFGVSSIDPAIPPLDPGIPLLDPGLDYINHRRPPSRNALDVSAEPRDEDIFALLARIGGEAEAGIRGTDVVRSDPFDRDDQPRDPVVGIESRGMDERSRMSDSRDLRSPSRDLRPSSRASNQDRGRSSATSK